MAILIAERGRWYSGAIARMGPKFGFVSTFEGDAYLLRSACWRSGISWDNLAEGDELLFLGIPGTDRVYEFRRLRPLAERVVSLDRQKRGKGT